MVNYKVTNKNDMTVVSYKQKDMLQINQREMGLFDSNAIPGFMKPKWETANEMSFIAPSAVPIKKYLSRNGSLSKVIHVLKRTFAMMNQVSENQLFVQNVLLDTKYVFVREMTGEVYFLYEPYLKNNAPTNVLAFLAEVINSAKLKDKNQKSQLEQLRTFLNSHNRMDELEAYMNQLEAGQNAPIMQNPAPPVYNLMEDEGTTVLSMEDEGTMVLNMSEDPETTVLRRDPILSLTRNSSGVKVQLTGNQCTIGRSADNYISIRDITDVSRHHAVISMNNGVYSLMDLGSTNGSTVNGRMIEKNVNETIQNGDVLAFAEEEFTFKVEE